LHIFLHKCKEKIILILVNHRYFTAKSPCLNYTSEYFMLFVILYVIEGVVEGKNALIRAALRTDKNYLFSFTSVCCPFHFPKQFKSFLEKIGDFFI